MRIAFTLVAFSLMTTVVVCHGLKYTTSLTAIPQDFKSILTELAWKESPGGPGRNPQDFE